MTWQITLNHVCSVLYDISLLAQAYRCMQMLCQTLLFKSAAWHGTFDMIISHLSDLTSPSSDRKCQRRWELMATLNMNLDKLLRNTGNQAPDWKCYLTKEILQREVFLDFLDDFLVRSFKRSHKKVSLSPQIPQKKKVWNVVALFMLPNSLVTEVSLRQS